MHAVTVSYRDDQNIINAIKSPLSSRLQRLSLQWDRADHAVSDVTVDVSLQNSQEIDRIHSGYGLFEQPLVNIYIIKCDNVEQYRSNLRESVREWHQSVCGRKTQEWLILLVIPTEPAFGGIQKPASAKFLGLRNSVLDKLNAEFDPTKDQHCAQIRLGDGRPEMEEAYEDLLRKLRRLLLNSIESRVVANENDIERMAQQASGSGWNYCDYFLLKESLALTYESLGMYKAALAEYHDTHRVLEEQCDNSTHAHLHASGGYEPGFESMHIIKPDFTKYRDVLKTKTITLFDMRIYIFARRAHALSMTDDWICFCSTALAFLTQQNWLLKGRSASRPGLHEKWLCHAVDDILDSLPGQAMNAQIAGVLGDIRNLKMQALSELVRLSGSDGTPTEVSDESHEGLYAGPAEGLQKALRDLCKQMDTDYKLSGRSYSLDDITAQLVASAISVDEQRSAIELLEASLGKISSPIPQPKYKLIAKLLKCLRSMQLWRKYVLLFMDCVCDQGLRDHLNLNIETILPILASHDIEIELPAESFFEVEIDSHASQLEGSPSICLGVTIRSQILPNISISSFNVQLRVSSGEIWEFESAGIALNEGMGSLTVSSREIRIGVYRPEAYCVTIGGLKIRGQLATSRTIKFQPHRYLCFRHPRRRSIGTNNVCLCLEASQHPLESSSVRLKFIGSKAKEDFQPDHELSEKFVLDFVHLEPYTLSDRSLLYTVSQPQEPLRCALIMVFTIGLTEFKYIDELTYDGRLPLSVNVQEYFRPNHILSKFEILSLAEEIKLKNLELKSTSILQVDFQVPEDEIISITPTRSLTQVYKIRSDDKGAIANPLQLGLSFSKLSDATRRRLKNYLQKLVIKHNINSLIHGVLASIVLQDEAAYPLARQFETISAMAARGKLSEILGPNDLTVANAVVEELFLDDQETVQSESDWTDLSIPVQLPQDIVVFEASMNVPQKIIAINEAIQVIVSLTAISIWSCSSPEDSYTCNIETNSKSWLVVGSTRSILNHNQSTTLQLILVPLQIGYLHLPFVEVVSSTGYAVETNLLYLNQTVLVSQGTNTRLEQIS